MSTIALTLFEESPAGLSTGPGFFRRAADAFGDGWRGLMEVLIAVVASWPLWLALAAGFLLFRRWRRRHPGAFQSRSAREARRKRSRPASQEPSPEASGE
jgi:hypothetical protein